MDKKILAFLAAAMMITASAGCKDKKDESSEESTSEPTTVTTEAAVTSTTAVTTAKTTTTAVTTTAAPVTTEPLPPITDEEMSIGYAQWMYDAACDYMWSFTVGCPYSIDVSQHIENQFGWQFYLITDENINSVADVRADYQKLFSRKYPDELDQLYLDHDGRVYALSGGRGSNIYYESSEITAIESQSDEETFFTVVTHMKGDDFGRGPYDETSTFSLVTEDNTTKVGKFKLPY